MIKLNKIKKVEILKMSLILKNMLKIKIKSSELSQYET